MCLIFTFGENITDFIFTTFINFVSAVNVADVLGVIVVDLFPSLCFLFSGN